MIRLEHVTRKYGHITALRDVTLEAAPGKITGLLGRNGTGKTTAMNLMAGYFPPDEGRVLIRGTDMLEKPRECRRLIGYLPEKPPLYEEMTVKDYLKFVCDLREVLPRAREGHTAEIMRICGLEAEGDRVIGHLSKGFRQRTGIAQALCGNPEALILDEPTVGLDPMQAAEIRELIRALGKNHTIVFSSHILSEVQALCDRVLILHEGRLIRSFDMRGEENGQIRLRMSVAGKERELLAAVRSIGCVRKAEALPAEEAGTAEIRVTGQKKDERGYLTDQLFRLMAAMDAPIRRMEPERDDLETVFLEAVNQPSP